MSVPAQGRPPLALSESALSALARRAADGERAAFERLHARFAGGLQRFFQQRTTPEAADELAQATWAELWRAVSQRKYNPERAAFSTFAYAVAGNLWRRSRRSEARVPPPPQRALEQADEFAAALEHAELLDALRACLRDETPPSALSRPEREILYAVSRGASERQIAQEMGLAASTVHERKLAALARLRQLLAQRGFSEGEQQGGFGQ